MGQSDLRQQVADFLVADGFAIERPAPHCVAGKRTVGDGRTETCFVWVRDPEAGIDPAPEALAADFAEAAPHILTGSSGFLVTRSLSGIGKDLRDKAAAAGVSVRVPIQFFDAAYRSPGGGRSGADRARSASERFRRLQREGTELAARRVAQPYESLSALGNRAGGFASGGDLLDRLVDALSAPNDGPELSIVLGNAGAGKSHLVGALYSTLHDRFMEAKAAHRDALRPVLFEPEAIRLSRGRRFDELLNAVAETEVVAGATPLPMMRFLSRAGFTLWMFDGLDEFFAGEGDFLAELDKALEPGSRARIVLCTRDSLMTSSEPLKSLVDRHIAKGTVRLYELAAWESASQRALAFVRRTGRMPKPGEPDPAEVASFMAMLARSEPARDLARLPFYCDLMLDLALDKDAAVAGPFALLETAVDRLIDREAGKLASGELGFGWDVFVGAESFVELASHVDAVGARRFETSAERERLLAAVEAIGRERLVGLLEAIAHVARMSEPYPNEARGLDTEEIEEIANFYLDVGLDPELEPRVLLALVQFAFFGQGAAGGHVRFAHPILADYLAARYALEVLRTGNGSASAIAQALGVRRDLAGNIAVDYLADALAREPDLAAAVRDRIEAGEVPERSRDAARDLLAAMTGTRA